MKWAACSTLNCRAAHTRKRIESYQCIRFQCLIQFEPWLSVDLALRQVLDRTFFHLHFLFFDVTEEFNTHSETLILSLLPRELRCQFSQLVQEIEHQVMAVLFLEESGERPAGSKRAIEIV